MILSEGQDFALKQLLRVAETQQSPLRIDHIKEKDSEADSLEVDVSVDCSHYDHTEDGLLLHDRESFRISISSSFPWSIPTIRTAHTRFDGFPHVQWGCQLCLYISAETQWDPSSGMAGYLRQLDRWLERAAVNQLDAEEGPWHPPVAYIGSGTTVYVHSDTPGAQDWPWIGVARIDTADHGLVSIVGWADWEPTDEGAAYAPAFLMDARLRFEYPRFVRTLLAWMEGEGIDTSRVLARLMLAAVRLPEGVPLRIVIGTPSRGIVGDDNTRKQHISVWEIAPEDTAKLRLTSIACDVLSNYEHGAPPEAIYNLIKPVFDDLTKWQRESPIRWCRVIENRPEIVVRRDSGSAMDWFKSKRVAIWGCGALGGQIAEHLVRAGVSRLVLIDNDRVDPGVLVRQNFERADLNVRKVSALERRLKAISSAVSIDAIADNILTTILSGGTWDEDVDLVIDATASLRIRMRLEQLMKGRDQLAPIASMMVSGAALHGILAFAPIGYSGGPHDVMRRLGLAAKNRDWLRSWVDAFWKHDTSEPARQPEPGCSDPTFVGSNADVALLASRMLNCLANRLTTERNDAFGVLISQDTLARRDELYHFAPDIVVSTGSAEYRLSTNAWRDAKGWISASARERGPEDETGGLLFGEYNESIGIAWVSAVSGPPSDSTHSPQGFECGIEGTEEICKEQKDRSLGAVKYIGTWHSHPVSAPEPSATDFVGIAKLFDTNPAQGPHQFMMIVGFASGESPEIGLYGFDKPEFVAVFEGQAVFNIPHQGGTILAPAVTSYPFRIGLSLSGGGSRAVAFHLGTLRALQDTNLLADVDIVSGVSGGSVITAMLAYSSAPFSEIDKKVTTFLKTGLARPAAGKLLNPARFLAAFFSWVVAVLPSFALGVCVSVVRRVSVILGPENFISRHLSGLRWPLRRYYSRSHVMADAIADVVGRGHCDATTRNDMTVVFNACELRTGTGFHMSNLRYGGWRFGWAPASELRIADAVAASAAYPALLPAFDWVKTFNKNDIPQKQRVLIADGGVYENMGVSVMEPEAHPDFSVVGYKPEVLIASDASAGQFTGSALPVYWTQRMVQVLNAVMRKVQDATKGRLHAHVRDRRIDAFVYTHLGQIDSRVPMRPSKWVSREEVLDYPTDFSAMSDANIVLLSGRGEAITRTLVSRYLLSD